jgi:hypothetical protein
MEGVRIQVLEASETQVRRVRISRLSLKPSTGTDGGKQAGRASGEPAGEIRKPDRNQEPDRN